MGRRRGKKHKFNQVNMITHNNEAMSRKGRRHRPDIVTRSGDKMDIENYHKKLKDAKVRSEISGKINVRGIAKFIDSIFKKSQRKELPAYSFVSIDDWVELKDVPGAEIEVDRSNKTNSSLVDIVKVKELIKKAEHSSRKLKRDAK
jgi:hypothetical protein